MSTESTSNYYSIDPTTLWRTYDVDKLENREACDVVITQCLHDARMERLKAGTKMLMSAGTTLTLLVISYAVGKVSALLVGVMFLPLMVIPPLFALLMLIGGIGAGSAFGYVTIKASGKKFWNEANQHWNYSNHLYQQAADASLRKAHFFRKA